MSVESFWELLVAKKDGASQQLLQEVLAKCQSLVSALSLDSFYGAVADSTVVTALLSVLQNSLPDTSQTAAVDHSSLVHTLVRAVATQLLQILKPHAFIQQAHAGTHLPASYEAFYTHEQEHYNLKQLLVTILGQGALPNLACGHNQAVMHHASESMVDQPESSAAAEARSAAAEVAKAADAEAAAARTTQSAVLESSPPQRKWVIFTSTTPDLDMGYILPSGNAQLCLLR